MSDLKDTKPTEGVKPNHWADQLALVLSAVLENPGGPFELDTAQTTLESYWKTRFVPSQGDR